VAMGIRGGDMQGRLWASSTGFLNLQTSQFVSDVRFMFCPAGLLLTIA